MILLKPGRFPSWILAFLTLYIYSGIRAADGPSVRINEFLAINSDGITDLDGDRSDWIELFNAGPDPVSLAGWSLTDAIGETRKWLLPDSLLSPGAFCIVFASDKNRSEAGSELHANFKLDGSGEYLALFDPLGRAASEFSPAYPEQSADVSFAFLDGAYLATARPTPGAENFFGSAVILPLPVFSRQAGYYDAAFDLLITASPENAVIRFTTDGSEPGADSETPVNGLIRIETTTVLRARAFLRDSITSRVATATFLFPEDIIRQSDEPPGYPRDWGPFTAIPGNAPADYGMDPEITEDPAYVGAMRESLLSLPALSIVTDRDGLFSKDKDPEKGGIYVYTGPPGDGDVPLLGDGWTRRASVELIQPDGSAGFQADCGLRMHGGHSRRPEKTPKHSFRLLFRGEYGPTRLEAPFIPGVTVPLNTVILRATYGNTWLHMNQSERLKCQLIHDLWAKDTQTAMGHASGRGFFVHLYINGLYWGVYNPTERIDADFAADALGGNAEDFDVVKDYGEAVDGTATAWNRLLSLADAGVTDDAAWMRIQGLKPDGTSDPSAATSLDAVSLIDYMLINFYGSNWDWDHHNWIAVRDRAHPGKGFQFFSWDAEHVIEDIEADILNENNAGRPSRLFQRLKRNPKFLKLLADRIRLHCFNGGALTPESSLARWNARSSEVEKAIVAESARWGDYRRDKHSWTAGPFELYTPEHWKAEREFLVNRYFPERTAVFISQLKRAGLFSDSGDTTSSVDAAPDAGGPSGFGLGPNFPNPFNPDTAVRFAIPDRADVGLEVFDVRGRRVRVLHSGRMEAGTHEIEWDGSDDRGLPCPSGVYILRLEADGLRSAREMVLER